MPQPIDPSTELLRITAAERVQQLADRLSLAAQHRAAERAQDLGAAQEQQVLQAREKDHEVDAEARRRTPYQGRRAKKREAGADDRARTLYTPGERLTRIEDEGPADFDVSV